MRRVPAQTFMRPLGKPERSSHKLLEEGSAPFANLFVTMARQAGIDIPGFADSDGVLSELVA